MKMNTDEMAKKIEELMTSGKTLTEALTEVQPKTTTGTRVVIADRVSWAKGLQFIAEVRKARKIAFAKKSKAKGKPETEAKYQAEIDACNQRLNELLAEVNQATFPYHKAHELGEDIGGVIQVYLDSVEEEINKELEAKTAGLTKKALKEILSATRTDTPARIVIDLGSLSEEHVTEFMGRASRGDQRVLTLVKKLNFLEDQTEPATVKVPATDEPTSEQSEGSEIEKPKRGKSKKDQSNEQ